MAIKALSSRGCPVKGNSGGGGFEERFYFGAVGKVVAGKGHFGEDEEIEILGVI